uniref:Uncharacterized protein n=1 Tax=Megaselia scalaris TaxID=36166 RepID=T1GVF5_MEGSC
MRHSPNHIWRVAILQHSLPGRFQGCTRNPTNSNRSDCPRNSGAIDFILWMLRCHSESYCMSMTYSILLFILMIAQLTLVVYMFIAKEDYLKHMEHVVDRAWDRRTQKADYMDGLQIGFKCCGNRDYRDYTYQGFVPATCCENPGHCSVENAYKNGCKSTFVNFWDKNSDIIKYAGLIIAAIEFVGFIFSCCLANNIRNYRRRSAY